MAVNLDTIPVYVFEVGKSTAESFLTLINEIRDDVCVYRVRPRVVGEKILNERVYDYCQEKRFLCPQVPEALKHLKLIKVCLVFETRSKEVVESDVELFLLADNLYLVGYGNRRTRFRFSDHICMGNVERLPYTGSYKDLEFGGKSRRTINLGQNSLLTSAYSLCRKDPRLDQDLVRCALLSFVVHIAEGCRFSLISDISEMNYMNGVRLTDEMDFLTNNWNKLSELLFRAERLGRLGLTERVFGSRDQSPKKLLLAQQVQNPAVGISISKIAHQTIQQLRLGLTKKRSKWATSLFSYCKSRIWRGNLGNKNFNGYIY